MIASSHATGTTVRRMNLKLMLTCKDCGMAGRVLKSIVRFHTGAEYNTSCTVVEREFQVERELHQSQLHGTEEPKTLDSGTMVVMT